ncbi:Uncharacterised protein [Salmonella enterica subsp. enterica]|nr:Uncharacterised protein [Salmonella enterica subsp. enterica]
MVTETFCIMADETPEDAFQRCVSEQRCQITEEIWLMLLVTLTDAIDRKNDPDTLKPLAASLRWETGGELLARLESAGAK